MVFSSNIFLFFFLPIFLIAYFVTPQKFRNYTLLLFSLVFYAYGAPDFVFLLVGECVVNYFIVRGMAKSDKSSTKKLLCALSVLMALGLLLYFKYANFFMENLNAILGWVHHEPVSWMKVALPIGISFFTFQSITYTLDVYRGITPPSKKLTDYVLYIMMFPQLIAGPIVNYNSVAAQLVDRTSTMEDRAVGFYRFIIGLAKKVLIANTLAAFADQVFAMNYGDLATTTAWIGILSYTFQIYFDFSGYSDMALGLGQMLGFRFPENFNFPYISQSVTEFWRRWHITLSTWIKDYLYIPMGGNRVPVPRMYFNLVFAFFISGFWHGAAWTFIFWGLFHGLFLVLDKVGMLKILKKIGRIPATILTFFVTTIGWVFFRAEDMGYAASFIRRLFAFDGRLDEFYCDRRFWFVFAVAVFFSFIGIFSRVENLQYNLYNDNPSRKVLIGGTIVAMLLFVLCGGALLAGGLNPFIYFRF